MAKHDDVTLSPEEQHAWNVACCAFAQALRLYRSENLRSCDMLLVAGFIVAHCHLEGDVQPAAEAVLAIARRVMSENLDAFVATPMRKPSEEN